MTALITGGEGFIGSAVARRLRVRKIDVETYDLINSQDVMNFEELSKAVKGKDVVFDCAGILGSAETFEYARETFNVNILGTLNIAEACSEHGAALIFMSLKNEWHNPYMISKRAATEICQMYAEYYGVRTAVVKGLNAYGPWQHWGKVRKIIPTFIVQAMNNWDITLYGTGDQIIDLIYVDDLAEIMIRLWEKGLQDHRIWGKAIDGGTGIPITVKQIANEIVRLTKSQSEIKFAPMRMGEPKEAVALADPTEVRQYLDYYPETPLDVGLEYTIKWYKDNWRAVKTGG